ncbi:hypothetical protein DVA86_25685 [Streptomyces armeniacus]|uniref:Uncharacterized protein n=1 Tax=Streptomyces armeniacus TaxID=83291 RepID=A0A345XV70_9ACTN|nr:hypothetical protein [Streptomyces armeniacus]AXK35536.1 hypothetical protein DVA86_25685 [Streptomyces armeniacus]
MREPDTASPGGSGTPIYDALYAEYRRLFRALPGDRSGEEDFRFERFGTVHGTGTGRWGDTLRQRGGALPAALPPAPRDGHRYGL